MIVTRSIEFPMGHRLKDHPGLCRHVHGHNYKVVAEVEGDLNAQGMVIDFSELKSAMEEVFSMYDHALVLQKGDLWETLISTSHSIDKLGLDRVIYMREPPTAEHLAVLWHFQLSGKMPLNCELRALTVFESSNTSARYEWKAE